MTFFDDLMGKVADTLESLFGDKTTPPPASSTEPSGELTPPLEIDSTPTPTITPLEPLTPLPTEPTTAPQPIDPLSPVSPSQPSETSTIVPIAPLEPVTTPTIAPVAPSQPAVTPKPWRTTILAGAGGTTDPPAGTYETDKMLLVRVTPNLGYTFEKWLITNEAGQTWSEPPWNPCEMTYNNGKMQPIFNTTGYTLSW